MFLDDAVDKAGLWVGAFIGRIISVVSHFISVLKFLLAIFSIFCLLGAAILAVLLFRRVRREQRFQYAFNLHGEENWADGADLNSRTAQSSGQNSDAVGAEHGALATELKEYQTCLLRLKLKPEASLSEIKKSYRSMMKQLHPDALRSNNSANQFDRDKHLLVSAAYNRAIEIRKKWNAD